MKLLSSTASWIVIPWSLGVNVLLAFLVLTLWVARPRAVATASAESAAKTAPAKPQASAAPAFRWGQLDAPDFPTFIKNLRAVGCPEATIRDIVQGELREIAEAKRMRASPEASSTNASPLNGMKTASGEETTLLSSLLGTAAAQDLVTSSSDSFVTIDPDITAEGKPSASEAAAATPSAPVVERSLTPAAFLVGENPAAPPSSHLSVATTDPQLNQATANVIERIRSDFATQMAGADPADSVAYRREWLAAQRASDEFFSSMFGGDAFITAQTQGRQRQAALARGAAH